MDDLSSGEQVAPRHLCEAVDVDDGPGGPQGLRLRQAATDEHQLGGIEDRVAHHARAHGCAGHEVGLQGVGVWVLRREAGGFRQEDIELSLAEGVPIEMRIALKDDLRPGDVAGEIRPGDHIKRNAGKARRMNDIKGREYVPDYPAILVVNGHRRGAAVVR